MGGVYGFKIMQHHLLDTIIPVYQFGRHCQSASIQKLISLSRTTKTPTSIASHHFWHKKFCMISLGGEGVDLIVITCEFKRLAYCLYLNQRIPVLQTNSHENKTHIHTNRVNKQPNKTP